MAVSVNPFANPGIDRFKKVETKLSMPKPTSSVVRENPFSKSNTIPKNFVQNSTNPFAKQYLDKENVVLNMPKPTPTYKMSAVVKPALHQIVKPSVMPSVHMSHPLMEPLKTRKQLIAEVMDYFLHHQITDELGSKHLSLEIDESKQAELQNMVVRPLAQAFLKDIPVNDSFKDLYNKNHMHDIQLYFERDNAVIPAHKIVLSTAELLRERIESHQFSRHTSGMSSIDFPAEYDSDIFGKVLKVMYTSSIKEADYSIQEYRAMYKLACKIRAKYVQRCLIVHKLLP